MKTKTKMMVGGAGALVGAAFIGYLFIKTWVLVIGIAAIGIGGMIIAAKTKTSRGRSWVLGGTVVAMAGALAGWIF